MQKTFAEALLYNSAINTSNVALKQPQRYENTTNSNIHHFNSVILNVKVPQQQQQNVYTICCGYL